MKIGILAYGSLIEEPGVEIDPLMEKIIKNVETPFKIEFSRTSSTRKGAPTLVLDENGSSVNGQILVLKDSVSLKVAKNLLWRRERRKERTGEEYIEEENPTPSKVIVVVLENFKDIDYVLYTKIGANIKDPTAEKLANLAIESAKKEAGKAGKDGISYLISVKRQGIKTPLMPEYEESILKKLNVETLEDAYTHCRKVIND